MREKPKVRGAFLAFAINPYFEIQESKRVEQESLQMLLSLPHLELLELPSLVFEEMAMGRKTFEEMESKVQENLERVGRFLENQKPDFLIIQSGTFNLDRYILSVVKNYQGPLVLWAYPEGVSQKGGLQINSLAGAISNNAALHKIGKPPEFLFGLPGEPTVREFFMRKVQALQAVKTFRNATLGLVGVPFTGYFASAYDEMLIRKILGLEFIHFEIRDFLREVEALGREEIEKVSLSSCSYLPGEVKCMVSASDLEQSGKAYLALRKLFEKHLLDFISIKCQPELKNWLDLNPCFSISRLADEGYVVGCEGDVGLALSMYLEFLLTGRPGVLLEIVKLNEEENLGVMWHCGQAPSQYADREVAITLERHTLAPGTTVIEFPFAPGRATIVRFAQVDGRLKLFAASGEVVKARNYFKGSYAEIRFDTGIRRVLETILDHGIEHHQALVYGDIVREVQEVGKLLDVEVILP
ncbi:MAG: L-fucose/L-arabinose isomerase family protein [Candidatus Caldatribacteriaceae bacterium]